MGETTFLGWRFSYLTDPFKRQQYVDLAVDMEATFLGAVFDRNAALNQPSRSFASRLPGGGFDTQVTVTVGTSALIPYAYQDGLSIVEAPPVTEVGLAPGLWQFETDVFRATPSGTITSYLVEIEVDGTSRFARRFQQLTATTAFRLAGVYTGSTAARVRVTTTGTAGVTVVMWGQLQVAKLVDL